MTTIAWDGKILATDSRITCRGHLISDKSVKLQVLNDLKYTVYGDIILAIALAGDAAMGDKFMYSLFANIKCEYNTEDNVNGVLIGDKNIYTLEDISEMSFITYPKDTLLTEGSGGQFAHSAMLLGLNAIEAIKHTMKLDVYTGGEVQSWMTPK